jgi:hypothetical protein
VLGLQRGQSLTDARLIGAWKLAGYRGSGPLRCSGRQAGATLSATQQKDLQALEACLAVQKWHTTHGAEH